MYIVKYPIIPPIKSFNSLIYNKIQIRKTYNILIISVL